MVSGCPALPLPLPQLRAAANSRMPRNVVIALHMRASSQLDLAIEWPRPNVSVTRCHILKMLSIGAAVLVGSGSALAQVPSPPPLDLAWLAPAGCPDSTRVRTDIEVLLGHVPEMPAGGAISAQV